MYSMKIAKGYIFDHNGKYYRKYSYEENKWSICNTPYDKLEDLSEEVFNEILYNLSLMRQGKYLCIHENIFYKLGGTHAKIYVFDKDDWSIGVIPIHYIVDNMMNGAKIVEPEVLNQERVRRMIL